VDILKAIWILFIITVALGILNFIWLFFLWVWEVGQAAEEEDMYWD
jgi:hypothetical protein